MQLLTQLTVVFLVGRVLGLESDKKLWTPDTKFDNPNNWDLKRVPCFNDRVIFPSSLNLGVALPSGTTILRELVLPRNGELFLPTNGVLQIGGGGTNAVSKCPADGDITFARAETEAWLNPFNWQMSPQADMSAVPHVDRIPCEHDVVQFKADGSVRLQLPTMPLTVATIRFGTQEMSNVQWQQWLGTETGYRQFVRDPESSETDPAVSIRPPPSCPDKSGCLCNSAKPQRLLRAVCKHVTSRCDTPPQCYYPVTPDGHCCPMCGATLLVKYDAAFHIQDLHDLVRDYLKDEQYSSVVYYARKTAYHQGHVQVVLAEKGGYQGKSADLASVLADAILKDMELGVTKVISHVAGPVILGSKLAHAAKTFFGTFFTVIIALGLVFYVFVVYRQGLPFVGINKELFQFARFQNAGADDEVALAIDIDEPHESDAVAAYDDLSPSKSFDNPMYGATGLANQGASFDPKKSLRGMTHVNPVYSELVRREGAQKEKEGDNKEEKTGVEEERQGGEDITDVDSDEIEEDDGVFEDILINTKEN